MFILCLQMHAEATTQTGHFRSFRLREHQCSQIHRRQSRTSHCPCPMRWAVDTDKMLVFERDVLFLVAIDASNELHFVRHFVYVAHDILCDDN